MSSKSEKSSESVSSTKPSEVQIPLDDRISFFRVGHPNHGFVWGTPEGSVDRLLQIG